MILQVEPGNPFKNMLEKAIEQTESDEYAVDEARKLLHSIVAARHDKYLVEHKSKPPKGQRGIRRGRAGVPCFAG